MWDRRFWGEKRVSGASLARSWVQRGHAGVALVKNSPRREEPQVARTGQGEEREEKEEEDEGRRDGQNCTARWKDKNEGESYQEERKGETLGREAPGQPSAKVKGKGLYPIGMPAVNNGSSLYYTREVFIEGRAVDVAWIKPSAHSGQPLRVLWLARRRGRLRSEPRHCLRRLSSCLPGTLLGVGWNPSS
ncbi:hypothetical protein BC829DRAFT_421061 [Chytridium lagenaria]|nr:hypothetical protein BC829DRAFT_421061 [Chytridium lagenaria]